MKFSNLNRIYIDGVLAVNSEIKLISDHIHYIKTVLRLKVNEQFRVFNNTDGEFIAQINATGKNNLSVNVTHLLRKPETMLPLTLALAIIKPEKFLLAINMAVQLGVTKIVPLITERCQFRNINSERLLKCVIEASEQSERLIVPVIDTTTILENYLAAPAENLLLYANEREDKANSLLKVLSPNANNIALIVGPEGGFTDEELKKLATYKNAKSFSLGSRILRAETAVAAGLAQIAMVRA